MHALMSMGHGDELCIADGNFPAASHAQKLVRASGQDVVSILDSIMNFLPIDPYVQDHAVVMQLEPEDVKKLGEPPVWKKFAETLHKKEGDWVKLTPLERQKFYERAKRSFVIIATSDTALYANLILKKGVVPPK